MCFCVCISKYIYVSIFFAEHSVELNPSPRFDNDLARIKSATFLILKTNIYFQKFLEFKWSTFTTAKTELWWGSKEGTVDRFLNASESGSSFSGSTLPVIIWCHHGHHCHHQHHSHLVSIHVACDHLLHHRLAVELLGTVVLWHLWMVAFKFLTLYFYLLMI